MARKGCHIIERGAFGTNQTRWNEHGELMSKMRVRSNEYFTD